MKENAYMSRETKQIIATLKVVDTQDVLSFSLDKDYLIHLKNDAGQLEIKAVFSALLECMLKQPLKLVLKVDDNYSNGLLKDVCSAYISDLNSELDQVARNIPETLLSSLSNP